MNDNTLKSGSLLKHGEYRIERTLGQGGFGITYEAEQVSLGRKVAVKEFFMKDYCDREDGSSHVTLSTSSSSRELVERFRTKFVREAKMIAGLDHDHIVKIIDVFEENGTAYYVMEYIGGGCLGDGVKAGKAMPEREAAESIRQIAFALEYLHNKGIIHFDVKPSNVLRTEDGKLKLIDFGISKHYDEAGVQTSSTPVGISKGYAPLEQYQQGSDIKSFTPATDIYSLGATLYALLSGSNPPEASIVNEDGVPVIDGVSPVVMHTIEKAMQPRRKDRPQSVAEFIALLDGTAKEGDSEETVIPGDVAKEQVSENIEKTVKKSKDSKQANKKSSGFPKWLIGVIIGVGVLLATFGVILFWPWDTQLSPSSGAHNGHEYVDLGLSVKWATCNVGASRPGDYGNYFAWGETSPKRSYDWQNLKYCTEGDSYANVKFSKYVAESEYGPVDNKIHLELNDDAARQNWGDGWRMPTINELQELLDNCIWIWTTMNGKYGYKVLSRLNNNTIFLPAAGWRGGTSLYQNGRHGYGFYWSSSLSEIESRSAGVLLSTFSVNPITNIKNRCTGLPVRPVLQQD